MPRVTPSTHEAELRQSSFGFQSASAVSLEGKSSEDCNLLPVGKKGVGL